MVRNPHIRLLPLLALLSPLATVAVHAQSALRAAAPDPLDAKASVPALHHQSPFAGYRGLADDKPLAWKDANDTVTRIGGWRSYAREAALPEPPAAAPALTPVAPTPAVPAAAPKPSGHGGATHKH